VISEGEIGYLALIFALALEQQKNPDYSKYNILIVCSSGQGRARLLMYKYQQTFGKYINQIYLCNQFELNGFDFSKVQYVFTTIPIV
jgi:lichenan operon transcriptional antiterminator